MVRLRTKGRSIIDEYKSIIETQKGIVADYKSIIEKLRRAREKGTVEGAREEEGSKEKEE